MSNTFYPVVPRPIDRPTEVAIGWTILDVAMVRARWVLELGRR